MSFFETELVISVFNAWTLDVVPQAEVVLFNIATSESFIGNTDSAGVYKVWVTPSQYSIYVNKSGFREFSYVIGVGGSFLDFPVPLIPTSGEPPPIPPTEVDVGITVKNQQGARLQGASVVLADRSGVTNTSGIVIFLSMPIAVLDWSVSLSGFHDTFGIIDTSKLTDLQVVMVPVSEPPPPPILEHTITVVVGDNDGNPIEGIRVRATRKEGGFDSAILTDSNGVTVFKYALTGTYNIYAISRGDVTYDTVEVFVDQDTTINLNVPLLWLLSISSSLGGGTDPASRDWFFENGSVIPVTANSVIGFKFVDWTLDGQTFTENPINVTIDRDHVLHAKFELVDIPDLQRLALIALAGLGGFILLMRPQRARN